MKHWVILDDTGKLIGTCEGTAQDARDYLKQLEEELPWDGHTWTVYERSYAV